MTSSAARAATNGEALREEGARVRAALASKRSDTLLRLFDFLLDQSLKGQQPNEREITSAIFDDTPSTVRGQGQNSRVYVFRLRKKLDEYYAGKAGARLLIPRGEYCIALSQPDQEDGEKGRQPLPDRRSANYRRGILLAAVAPIVAIGVALAWIGWAGGERAPRSLADTAFWRPLADQRPETVVLGDYFLFGERGGPGLPTKIIRDLSTSSREDFHARVIRDAPDHRNLVDLNLHFVSSNATYALRSVWTSLRQIRGKIPNDVTVISASQLDPDILKSSDIIYLGPFDGLGKLLRNPLFQASGFKIGANYSELIDKTSASISCPMARSRPTARSREEIMVISQACLAPQAIISSLSRGRAMPGPCRWPGSPPAGAIWNSWAKGWVKRPERSRPSTRSGQCTVKTTAANC